MTWLETAIAQHNHRLELRLAHSYELPTFDLIDIELIKRERSN